MWTESFLVVVALRIKQAFESWWYIFVSVMLDPRDGSCWSLQRRSSTSCADLPLHPTTECQGHGIKLKLNQIETDLNPKMRRFEPGVTRQCFDMFRPSPWQITRRRHFRALQSTVLSSWTKKLPAFSWTNKGWISWAHQCLKKCKEIVKLSQLWWQICLLSTASMVCPIGFAARSCMSWLFLRKRLNLKSLSFETQRKQIIVAGHQHTHSIFVQ